MAETSIEWTRGDDGSAGHAINPIRARAFVGGEYGAVGHYCEKISPGCAHCYASALQKRFRMPAFGSLKNRGSVDVFLDDSKLQEVLRRRKPTKYFWCDMTDLFGEWVPCEWIDKCFAAMALTPQHVHQVLTKRPERMAEYLTTLTEGRGRRIDTDSAHYKRGQTLSQWARSALTDTQQRDLYMTSDAGWWYERPNVWLGTSVEDQQRADERIPHLLRCPAAVRFLSCEPLIGPIDLTRLGGDCSGCTDPRSEGTHQAGTRQHPSIEGIDWVICGGESGANARPCNVEWIRSIVHQCGVSGAKCFVKQLGAHVLDSDATAAHPFDRERWPDGTEQDGARIDVRDPKGGAMDEWPADLRVRQFPT